MARKKISFRMSCLHHGIAAGVIIAATASCENSIKEEGPNILWITIEDTSPQFIGFYGNKHVKTPNIDRLAGEGVIFTNAFASGPVCSASRSTLITGVNTEQLGTGNHRSRYPLPDHIRGFPSYLRKSGYYTTNNVKTDYNTTHEKEVIAASWDESSRYAGWWNMEGHEKFFSVVNFTSCHQSRTMTHPWNWYSEFVLGRLQEDEITSPGIIEVPPVYRDTEDMRRNLSRVYNSLNLTDIEIGLLLDSLERDGLMESTIIFFYSDHGQGIPRGKSSSVGLSYRVPFFIWFPEKYKHLSPWETGQSTDELISFEDLPPTILSLAGAEIPGYMTGRPILGRLRQPPPRYVYGSRNRIDESPDLVRTATDGRYFYIREFFPRYPTVLFQKYADVSDIVRSIRRDYAEGLLNREQSLLMNRRYTEHLYDLVNDPWEINNLAGNPEYSLKLAELRSALYERLTGNEDLHFLPEYEIQKISAETSPYEFRRTGTVDLKEVIDAAYIATDPGTPSERLYQLLADSNPFIRYWAAVGINNTLGGVRIERQRIYSALYDDYPPVRIEAAAVAWDHFKEDEAREVLIEFAKDRNPVLALHALQMMLYLKDIDNDMLSAVELIYNMRSNSIDDYTYDLNIHSICEVIMHICHGKPLFYENMAEWADPEHLAGK